MILRKLNLLTAKHRPLCSFCNGLCGFIWHAREEYALCDTCYKKGNYPDGQEEFEERALPDSHWERLHRDITPELEHAARTRPQSSLTHEEQ